MLAPLNRITDATREAARGSLSHRIQLPGRRDEFRDLADAFDAMLTRLEAHVTEQQRFAANASHELRTPLATTQALLDVARSDPDHDREKLDERLRAVNSRAIGLTESLLLLSRANQQGFTREYVDLSLLVEEAAETLLPFAEKRGVTIECPVDITRAFGSRSLLLQMTTNLLHNAIVHNLPAHGLVRVNTFSRPGLAVLTIVNTGAELTPQLVSRLTEPFLRGAGRTSTPQGGIGLGLASHRQASPRRTTEPSSLPPASAGGSPPQCNCPPRRPLRQPGEHKRAGSQLIKYEHKMYRKSRHFMPVGRNTIIRPAKLAKKRAAGIRISPNPPSAGSRQQIRGVGSSSMAVTTTRWPPRRPSSGNCRVTEAINGLPVNSRQ
jgi:two-component system sensor histidine kinase VanS